MTAGILPLVTPIELTSTVDATVKTDVDVSWATPSAYPKGTTFNIQFVNRSNPSDIVKASGNPYAATLTGSKYTQKVPITAPLTSTEMTTGYQTQIQAVPKNIKTNADSLWGKQIYWCFGPSITIKIGSTSLTLYKLPTESVFILPVSPSSPLTVSYADLKAFAMNFDSHLVFPKNWPNSTAAHPKPIDASLNVSRFAIDTKNKLLDVDVYAELNWEIFSGLTVQQIGLVLQRTNGIPIAA